MDYSANNKLLIDRLTSSRARILSSFPFYGVMLMSLNFEIDKKEKSFSTNGKTVFFNPDYLTKLNDYEIDVSVMHELLHIILKHPYRYRKSQMNNDLYHLASDIVVNSNIMESLSDKSEGLYILGKELPHLAPNKKEGRLYSTEEVYEMLIKKYPHMLTGDQNDDDDLDSDNDESPSSDTFEQQIGPTRINPAFTFNTDQGGHLYFKSQAFYKYDGAWNWSIDENYSVPDYNYCPQLLCAYKYKDMVTPKEMTIVNTSKMVVLPLPLYVLDEQYYYQDFFCGIDGNAKDIKVTYYKHKMSEEALTKIFDLPLDKNAIKEEKNYAKFAHKMYTSISPLYQRFFTKFAKEKGIVTNTNGTILACRNAIAQSAKYNLMVPCPPRGQDDLLYFLTTSKQGKCTQFATALVFLYRALGYPSRLVGGYLVKSKPNTDCICYVEDGHAWTEVYVDGVGWINMDPTPISGSGSSSQNKDDNNKDDKDNKKDMTSGFDSHNRWTENECSEEEKLMNDDEIDARLIEANEIQNNSNRGCGHLPGFIVSRLAELRDPQIDWRVVLNDFIQENIVDYSFTPPDNRFQDSEFILPSFSEKDEEIKNVLFMIDCSGSMSDKDIANCFSEIKGAIEQFHGKLKGFVGFFDTMVYKVHPFEEVEDILKLRPTGRGGTDFSCVFNYMRIKMIDELPTSLIILTDGEADYPPQRMSLDVPTLWVINNKYKTPTWGKILRITAKGK